MRRMLLTLSTVFALVALAAPLDAQLPVKIGVQGAVVTSLEDVSADPTALDLNSTFGAGVRAALQPPLFPVGVVAQGVYYFPDLTDSSFLTYSLAAQLRLSTPLISPYAIGGWQWRRASVAGVSNTENGLMVGVGAQLSFGLFAEATMEFNEEVTGLPDFDTDPIVIKVGIIFGG